MDIVTQVKAQNKRYLPHELSTKISSVNLYRLIFERTSFGEVYNDDPIRKITSGIRPIHTRFPGSSREYRTGKEISRGPWRRERSEADGLGSL